MLVNTYKDTPEFVKHPMLRSIESLQMLPRSAYLQTEHSQYSEIQISGVVWTSTIRYWLSQLFWTSVAQQLTLAWLHCDLFGWQHCVVCYCQIRPHLNVYACHWFYICLRTSLHFLKRAVVEKVEISYLRQNVPNHHESCFTFFIFAAHEYVTTNPTHGREIGIYWFIKYCMMRYLTANPGMWAGSF